MASNIGSAIRIVRHAKGLKLGALADAAGISIAFLSLMERGEREPSVAVIQRIADALDIPVDALMVLAQPAGSKLRTVNARAKKLAASVRLIADAEASLREWLMGHGGQHATERDSA